MQAILSTKPAWQVEILVWYYVTIGQLHKYDFILAWKALILIKTCIFCRLKLMFKHILFVV